MEANALLNEFTKNCNFRLDESLRMIERTFVFMEATDLWRKPNSSLNSVGHLILHICGNMSQYVLSGVGGLPDHRDRTAEFTTMKEFSKDELLEKLRSTVERVQEVIKNSPPKELLEIRSIQGFEFSGIGAIIHAVEHFSYHTGQIAFWVKYLKSEDLGFYDGFDLTQSNA
jgi:uncharacterized damage-inducible protein DinB